MAGAERVLLREPVGDLVGFLLCVLLGLGVLELLPVAVGELLPVAVGDLLPEPERVAE